MRSSDVVVLGAGMVGICVALHLQKRSRSVVLVDRRGAADLNLDQSGRVHIMTADGDGTYAAVLAVGNGDISSATKVIYDLKEQPVARISSTVWSSG